MVDYAPRANESPAEHRARVKMELEAEKGGVGAGPSADERVEAAKAKVRADNQAKARQRVSDPKNAVNRLDSAAETDDQVRATHKRLAGGVKPVVPDTEADKGKSDWNKMSEEEQIAAARGAKPAHSTSTPGSSPKTAGAEAMSRARDEAIGRSAAPPPPVAGDGTKSSKSQQRRITITTDAATSARNNMGAPRGGDRGGVLGGVASHDSAADLEAARNAAKAGARNPSKRQAEAKAAMASSRRSAASVAPVKGPQFSRLGDSGAEVSSAPGRDWITPSQIKGGISAPAPVTNPAPHSPVPAANATPAAPSTPTRQPSKPLATKPNGSGLNVATNMQAGYTPSHMASSAPGRDWLTPQAANKAKAAKAPKAASVEPITPAPKATPAAPPVAPRAPQVAPPAPSVASPSPAPSRTPTPQNTPLSAQMPKATPAPASAPKATRAASPVTPAPALSAPAPSAAPIRTGTPVATPPAPSGGGRSGIGTPRNTEFGGGRGGLHQGGEHNVNIGGDNYGQITHHHNTYNVNYGTNYGSMGNVDHGYAPRGGGRAPTGAGPLSHDHGGHFNVWVKDSHGHHDLQKTMKHVTGQTNSHGHPTTHKAGGGTQKPLAGSARSSGTGTSPAATGTGTTTNWSGPQHQNPTSASGNGTANGTP